MGLCRQVPTWGFVVILCLALGGPEDQGTVPWVSADPHPLVLPRTPKSGAKGKGLGVGQRSKGSHDGERYHE